MAKRIFGDLSVERMLELCSEVKVEVGGVVLEESGYLVSEVVFEVMARMEGQLLAVLSGNKMKKKYRRKAENAELERDKVIDSVYELKVLIDDMLNHIIVEPKFGDRLKYRQVAQSHAAKIIREMGAINDNR